MKIDIFSFASFILHPHDRLSLIFSLFYVYLYWGNHHVTCHWLWRGGKNSLKVAHVTSRQRFIVLKILQLNLMSFYSDSSLFIITMIFRKNSFYTLMKRKEKERKTTLMQYYLSSIMPLQMLDWVFSLVSLGIGVNFLQTYLGIPRVSIFLLIGRGGGVNLVWSSWFGPTYLIRKLVSF